MAAGAFSVAVADGNNENNKYEKEKSVKQTKSAEKPQLIISGEASFHPNFGNPSNKYYGKAVESTSGKDSDAGKVTKSGFENNVARDFKNDIKYDKANKDTSMTRFVAGEADIDVKAIGKLDNGIEYMVEFDIDAMKDDTEVDKMYLSFSRDDLGTLHLGNVKGPDAKCIYSGQQLLGGTCGMDGTIPHSFDFATGVIAPVYMIGNSSKATKIAYYTPRFYGFQLSASITPDTKHFGHNDKDWRAGSGSTGNDNGMFVKGKGDHKPTGRNNIAVALTHTHEFSNGIRTKLSGIYLSEDTKKLDVLSYTRSKKTDATDIERLEVKAKAKLRKVSAYQLSATVGYKKWDIGIGFLDNGRSRTLKSLTCTSGNLANDVKVEDLIGNFLGTSKANAGKAWNIGARYQLNDQWTISGVFHHTKRKVDTDSYTRGNMLTLAADWKIVDGLAVFFEADYIKTKSSEVACQRYNMIYKDDKDKNAIKKQNGTLFAVGVKVCF